MKKFFTITLLLLVMAANVIAQNQHHLLDQCKDENLRQYGEYLLNPQSLDDETAVRLGCAILSNVGDLVEKSSSYAKARKTYNDGIMIPKRKGLEIGLTIAILKTMPADIKLRQTYGKGIYFFDNGKVFVRNLGNVEIYGSFDGNLTYGGQGISHHVCGFLYDPFGESGFGTLMKAEDSKKDYFPKTLLTTKLDLDDLEKDLGGDYVIGSGLLFNLQSINGTDLFFDWLDEDNEITYRNWKFEEKLKLQKDPDYNVYAEIPMRSLYWSPSDVESYFKVAYAIDEKVGKAYEAKERAKEDAKYEAKYAPYKKKYGAAAFNRADNGQVWIGMPVGLVELFYRRVKKTQSFGGTVEIYVGYGKRIWVTNGKVSKIVSK